MVLVFVFAVIVSETPKRARMGSSFFVIAWTLIVILVLMLQR
jgi:hypothetical protein